MADMMYFFFFSFEREFCFCVSLERELCFCVSLERELCFFFFCFSVFFFFIFLFLFYFFFLSSDSKRTVRNGLITVLKTVRLNRDSNGFLLFGYRPVLEHKKP